ncbi:MAG: phosphatidylethanolamine N-methyltransferase, partial [Nitrosospira sp.]
MSLRHSYTVIAPLYDALLATAGTGVRAASLGQLPQQGDLNVLISGIGSGLDLPHLPPCHRYVGLDLTAA